MSSITHDQTFGLRLTTRVPAPPDRVFSAYTEPDAQRQWLSQLGPDAGEVRTSVDLRVGGIWEATFRANPDVLVHDVFTYLDLERPRRVVTRHMGESTVGGRTTPPIRTRIEVELVPDERGTLLTVAQTGFADTQTRDFFETVAWPAALERISVYLQRTAV